MTEATIAHVQRVVAEKGTDAWWQLPLEELLPEELRDQAPRLEKGEDTMVSESLKRDSWSFYQQMLPKELRDQAPRLKKGEDTMVTDSLTRNRWGFWYTTSEFCLRSCATGRRG